MTNVPPGSNGDLEALVAEVADDFLQRQKNGEHPDVAEYTARYPHAADLLLTGRHVTAEDAAAMGLVNQALPPEEVLPATMALAHDVAVNTAPLSVAISKRLLWASPALDADEVDRLETAMHRHVMGAADAQEGVLAFLERREPSWSLSPTKDWPSGW